MSTPTIPTTPTITDYLTLYDAYCDHFIRLNPTLTYRVAQSNAEREAHFRLRYEQVVAAGWATPADLPDGLEYDAYDDESVIINGWHGATLVISGRVVLPRPGRLLPMEADFDLRIEPIGQVVEGGRSILVHALQKDHPFAFLGLLGASWQATRERGYSAQAAVMNTTAARLYRIMGMQLIKLGEPHLHWGEMRFPALLNIPATVQYFQQHTNLTALSSS